MIRVYIKDGVIVKTINEWFFDTEPTPEGCEIIDAEFDFSDNIVYKDWEIKLAETE